MPLLLSDPFRRAECHGLAGGRLSWSTGTGTSPLIDRVPAGLAIC
jgi:hypothetical protein